MTSAIDNSLIAQYQEDGVIHLKQVFDQHWIDTLKKGIDKDLAKPSPRFEARTTDDNSARYCEDFWVWSVIPEFEDFVRHSPAASLAASLMGASRINLVMDNWFFARGWRGCTRTLASRYCIL